jgi:hypothetical protein
VRVLVAGTQIDRSCTVPQSFTWATTMSWDVGLLWKGELQ